MTHVPDLLLPSLPYMKSSRPSVCVCLRPLWLNHMPRTKSLFCVTEAGPTMISNTERPPRQRDDFVEWIIPRTVTGSPSRAALTGLRWRRSSYRAGT